MRVALPVILILLAAVPIAEAHSDAHATAPGHRVLVKGDAAPAGAEGSLTLADHVPGERYAWNVTVIDDYETIEFLLEDAVDVARARQLVPLLHVGDAAYPLFHAFPHARVWEVDDPARVAYAETLANGSLRLRLGIPGPSNGTLVLARDVTPPAFELGPIVNLTHVGFYRETTTEELALADLQVRKPGADEWVRNPTPVYHVLQKFPVQGLDPDTTYETRVVFTDWAGNENVSEIVTITTPPRPVVPEPVVMPLAPSPDGTIEPGRVHVQARVESPDAELADVRVFFDLKEVREALVLQDGVLSYRTGELAPGLHTVSVEARNVLGGESFAKWSFDVASAQTPGASALAALAVLGLAGLLRARR